MKQWILLNNKIILQRLKIHIHIQNSYSAARGTLAVCDQQHEEKTVRIFLVLVLDRRLQLAVQESKLKFRKILTFFYQRFVFFLHQHGKPLFSHYLV